jgi:hypothetical protein
MGSFSPLHWAIAIITLALVALFFRGLWRLLFPGKGQTQVCTTCGHLGPTRMHTRGTIVLEILLWLLFLVPGLIYSLWRLSTRQRVCTACGGSALVPPDTPAGKRLVQDAERA